MMNKQPLSSRLGRLFPRLFVPPAEIRTCNLQIQEMLATFEDVEPLSWMGSEEMFTVNLLLDSSQIL